MSVARILANQLAAWLSGLWQQKQCLLCMQLIQGQQALCAACEYELPWLRHGCRYCALPIPEPDISCRRCQRHDYPFSKVIAPWQYDFPVSSLIGRFKYNAGWSYGLLLSQALARQLEFLYQEQQLARPDFLLAVPLAKKRLRQRGYNQSQMIAQWLSSQLKVDLLQQAVQRVRYTRIQQGLSATQRELNMHLAFKVRHPELLAGKNIAVVDDVLTTGATCAALSQVLLDVGASRVDVYCLARTGLGRDKTTAKI